MDHSKDKDPQGRLSDAIFRRQTDPLVEQAPIPGGDIRATSARVEEPVTRSQNSNVRRMVFTLDEDEKSVNGRGLIVTVKGSGGTELPMRGSELIVKEMARSQGEVTLKGEK